MTRRERLERRAERRREWADSRNAHASQHFNTAREIGSHIPMGQPILVGHHSERGHRADLKRIDSNMRKGVESSDMAERHTSKADNIERQLDRSVFSDDHDAIGRLEARIAEREAYCERIKAYNKTCRAAAKRGEETGDLSLLDEDQKKELLTLLRIASFQVRPGGAFPSYVTSNMRQNINTDRKRLETIKRQHQEQEQAEANGGVLITEHGEGLTKVASVTFSEKPPYEVRQSLKSAGFRWSGGSWVGYASRLPEMVSQ